MSELRSPADQKRYAALLDREREIEAFAQTFAGRFQTNEGKAMMALHRRLIETLIYGAPKTPMPGQANP